MLTYTVFAPIHDNAVSNPAVDSDFKMGYYSGAFLPKSFSIDSTIVLDKNPNYHFASETKINRIREIHTSGTVSQTRDLFEANTINNYLINTNDQSGWDKYVGNASEPIKTDGLVRYDEDAEDAYTQMLFFNFLNSSYFGDTNAKKEAIIKSKLFQFSGTREFFFANLDRSIWGKYYSKIFDGDRSVSSNVRNTFVPDFIKSESKDFQTIEAEQINSEKLYGNAGTNVKKEDIKDGENFYSARAYGLEITNNSSKLKTAQSESAKKLREDLSSADNDLKEALKDGKKITLKTYLDPSKTTDERAALIEMFKTFSAIENNPITIDVITSRTSNEYQQMLDDGVEDLAISGWSPDYADAMSYSNTLKINGDHGMHFRFGQLYQFDDSKTPLNQFDSESADDTFTRLKNAHKDMYNELLIQNGEGENLFKSRYNYSKELVNVDETESGLKRNEDFAKLEAQTLYKDYFAMPLIRRSPSMTFTITNLVPFTSSRVPYGLSALQFGNYDFSSKLLSYDKIEDLRIAYLSKKDEVDKDKTKYRDSLAWQ
ncbi:hypothetical protein [Spiroplasma turonicum]|uniref:Oligopeptide-binding protein SarA n=1 Tax=Spiroplasma turonicum TaxID=216946 RepID=A0A0K1P5V3_9MOLU|nr:oligopeptide-binding protein SarA [Spiroplasma turonicum]